LESTEQTTLGGELTPVGAETITRQLHAALAFAFISAFAFATVGGISGRWVRWRRGVFDRDYERKQLWKANDIHRTLHNTLK